MKKITTDSSYLSTADMLATYCATNYSSTTRNYVQEMLESVGMEATKDPTDNNIFLFLKNFKLGINEVPYQMDVANFHELILFSEGDSVFKYKPRQCNSTLSSIALMLFQYTRNNNKRIVIVHKNENDFKSLKSEIRNMHQQLPKSLRICGNIPNADLIGLNVNGIIKDEENLQTVIFERIKYYLQQNYMILVNDAEFLGYDVFSSIYLALITVRNTGCEKGSILMNSTYNESDDNPRKFKQVRHTYSYNIYDDDDKIFQNGLGMHVINYDFVQLGYSRKDVKSRIISLSPFGDDSFEHIKGELLCDDVCMKSCKDFLEYYYNE